MSSSSATCFLVANASRARYFRRSEPMAHLSLVRSFEHPASRLKSADLVTGSHGHGLGASTYVPRQDAHDQEPPRFAHELARYIDSEVAAGRCDALVIAASPRFLGDLRGELGDQARLRVTSTLATDMTMLDGDALAQRIDAALACPA